MFCLLWPTLGIEVDTRVVASSRFSGGSLGYYRTCHVAYIRHKGDARGAFWSVSLGVLVGSRRVMFM